MTTKRQPPTSVLRLAVQRTSIDNFMYNQNAALRINFSAKKPTRT